MHNMLLCNLNGFVCVNTKYLENIQFVQRKCVLCNKIRISHQSIYFMVCCECCVRFSGKKKKKEKKNKEKMTINIILILIN